MYIVQHFIYGPQGTDVKHRSFVEFDNALAYGRALKETQLQGEPNLEFTEEVWGTAGSIRRVPVKNKEWEKFQLENPNFYWNEYTYKFEIRSYLPQAITLYEGVEL